MADTYPLYSKSDQVLIGIGDAYAGEAHNIEMAPGLNGAVSERMRSVYQDKAAAAYAKVITRYPMAPHVEDARDRLVAMNRPVPEPTQAAIAESDAEERSRQPLHFTDTMIGIIKRGPTVVEAVHVGEPTLDDPTRTLAPDVTKQNKAVFMEAVNAGKPPAPAAAVTPTGPNEPPRSDQPSTAPLQMQAPAGGTGVGVEVVNAPTAQLRHSGAADPNALVKPSRSQHSTVAPGAEKPAEAPIQVNDIKPGENPAQPATQATSEAARPRSPRPT